MKLIYSYSDYRQFIRDHLSAQKNTVKKLSARGLSIAAKLGPPNYLSLILDGKRRLSIAGALALSDLLGLRSDEVRYFIALVSYCESKDKREKEFFHQQLKEYHAEKPKGAVKMDREEFSADWRTPIILMLATGKAQKAAVTEVSQKLRLSVREAEELLGRLSNTGLLRLNECYEVSHSYFSQRDRKSIKQSHAEFLKFHAGLLSKSLARRYSPEAKHIVHVLGAEKGRKQALFSVLEQTSEECARLVNNDETEEIYVMHLHCTPLEEYLY